MAVITEQQINIINRRGRGKLGQLFRLKLPPLSTSAIKSIKDWTRNHIVKNLWIRDEDKGDSEVLHI